MWQLWHNWQLTAVATFAQAAHAALTAPAISEKPNQRQATHVTLQFIYMYFEACNKIKFINSQRQRREEELQPPTRQSRNSFSGRAKLSRVCQCVSASMCSFIQKDSFAFAIRLREASSRLAPLLSPLSMPLLLLPASIYAHHVFSFSRMTKYRLLRCNTKLRAVWQRRRSLQLAWAMAKNII